MKSILQSVAIADRRPGPRGAAVHATSLFSVHSWRTATAARSSFGAAAKAILHRRDITTVIARHFARLRLNGIGAGEFSSTTVKDGRFDAASAAGFICADASEASRKAAMSPTTA
jgi:hypothetical protein